MIEQGAYILIAAGAFIFIISFLGYCGAIKESRVLLTAYGLFIIIISLLQVKCYAFPKIYLFQCCRYFSMAMHCLGSGQCRSLIMLIGPIEPI